MTDPHKCIVCGTPATSNGKPTDVHPGNEQQAQPEYVCRACAKGMTEMGSGAK